MSLSEGEFVVNRKFQLTAGLLLLITLAMVSTSAGAYYKDAEVRAILFNCEKAAAMGNPVVLLAHQTTYEMNGNGPRDRTEHYLWYIADPNHPDCNPIKYPRIDLDASLERFGLRHCLVYRDGDTLRTQDDDWKFQLPPGGSPNPADPWRIATAPLPELQPGDVVDLAYKIFNPWKRTYYPSEWLVEPLTAPNAPTIERGIFFQFNGDKPGAVRILGDNSRPMRHRGGGAPMFEILTGNLPRGPADPIGFNAPRVYYTSHSTWENVRESIRHLFAFGLSSGEPHFSETGRQLAQKHRKSLDRVEAIYELLEEKFFKIEEPVLHSIFYPRLVAEIEAGGSTKPLDRALVFSVLCSTASLHADIFFARSIRGGFMSDFYSPSQFDQILLRVYLIDEDRFVFIDPWAPNFKAGLAGAPEGTLLMGLDEEWAGLRAIGADGAVVPFE
jgi:hypothetical protein